MEPVVLIVNPAAGRGLAGAKLSQVQDWVAKNAPHVLVRVTSAPGHASELVGATTAATRIVVVGGDGTVHEAVRGLAPRQKLGIVPIGSGNDIARMAGLLGGGLAQKLATAVWGETRSFDMGVVNGEPYVSSATAGLDAEVARRALTAPRYLRGLPRYLWALFAVIRSMELPRASVRVDGREVYQGPILITAVMNSPTYGGGFHIAPMADPSDARLDLIWAQEFSKLGVIGILPRLVLGRHVGHPRIGHRAGFEFEVEFDREVQLQSDGELLDASDSMRVRVEPAALQIACEPAAREGLTLRAEKEPLEKAKPVAGALG